MASLARAWPLLLLAACSHDERFESLGLLCADLAEDICDARAGCCANFNPNTCVQDETTRCQTELDAFEKEDLRYSATAAFDKRGAARSELDHCGNPPALASFFTGGLADGAACERDTQCSGGQCATGQCAATEPELCTP